MKVDKSKFMHDTWENDWYYCPNCNFDSLDVSFNYCPACGQNIHWSDEEEESA